MKSKNIIIIGIISIVIILIGGVVVNLMLFSKKSVNKELSTNYQDVIYVSSKAKFLMIVDNSKILNLIFLNKEASSSLKNNGIEGMNFEKGVEKTVDRLKNNNLLNDTKSMEISSLKQSTNFNKIIDLYNKDLVIYGVNKEINSNTFTLENIINELGLNSNATEIENLKTLDSYSKRLLKS